MSLGVSPHQQPIKAQRPAAPGRIRRHSFLPTSNSKLGLSTLETQSQTGTRGVLGGLRERSEDELKRASRDELEGALTRAWSTEERLLERVADLENTIAMEEKSKQNSNQAIHHLEARHDNALQELSRLDAELEEQNEVIERFRGRATEAERHLRDAQKRAMKQEKSFEAERAALQAQETHLQQRILSLMSRNSTPSSTSSPSRPVSELQEEIASLHISHSTLVAQVNTLSKDIHELRLVNAELEEENEGYEFLLKERTLSGKVLENPNIFGNGEYGFASPSQLDVLDEQLEMEELHSDLQAQSPIFEDGHRSERDLDQISTSPGQGGLTPQKKIMRKSRSSGGKKDSPGIGNTTGGLDLAAELGRAEVDLGDDVVAPTQGQEEVNALRAELQTLRESNKALSLYCSKIIDRIISQEGFEHVLSVDYKTRRMGRSASSSSRANLRDITNVLSESAPPMPQQSDEFRALEGKQATKARPLSMMARAFSSTTADTPIPEESSSATASATVPEPTNETKSEKRARRGFSLDFRSLGFGLSSPSPTAPSVPALKPLALASKVTTTPTINGQARKLEVQEEDEEDRRERHRMEAALKSMMDADEPSSMTAGPGDTATPTQPTSRKLTKAPPGRSSSSSSSAVLKSPTQSAVWTEAGSSDTGRKPGTPLSRLTSALGGDDLHSSYFPVLKTHRGLGLGEDEGGGEVSPEMAQAALRAFDEREKEKVLALSKGTAVTGYTSPTSSGIRKKRVASGDSGKSYSSGDSKGSRRLSGTSPDPGLAKSTSHMVDSQAMGTSGTGHKTMPQSSSISTLWSMGSSKRDSGEFSKL